MVEYFQKVADLIAEREFPEAIKTLEEFICMEPREPLVYEFLGDLYLHLHNPKRALPPLKQAIKLAPHHHLPYELLSKTYEELGQLEQAKRYRSKAKTVQNTTEANGL